MFQKLRINWPIVLIALAFFAFAGYQSLAIRHLLKIQPPVVATVDLHRLMTQTQERKVHDAAVRELIDDLNSQGANLRKKLDEIEEELLLHSEGSDKYQETLEKLSLTSLEFQGFNEWARRKIEAESAIRLRRLYASLRKIIEEEARASGYDIVMVNDSLGEIRAGDEAEVTMQITARRMLYASQHLDITSDIIARMDAAVQAQGN